MDAEQLIKVLISEGIEKPYEAAIKRLDECDTSYTKFVDAIPREIPKFKEYETSLRQLLQITEEVPFSVDANIFEASIDEYCKDLELQWCTKADTESNRIMKKVLELKADIEAENRKFNEKIKKDTNVNNATFEELEAKRKVLESYSDKIFDLCCTYGIKTGDVEITDDTFSIDQLNDLYDKYIEFMKKEEVGVNPIRWLREICPDSTVQGIVIACAIVAMYTPVLNFLSLLFFGLLIANQMSQSNKVNYYAVLMGITFNVNPLTLGFKDLDKSLLKPEEITEAMMDEDERFEAFGKELDALQESFAQQGFEEQRDIFNKALAKQWVDINEKIMDYTSIFSGKKSRIISDIKDLQQVVKDKYQYLVDNYIGFGDFAVEYEAQVGPDGKTLKDREGNPIPKIGSDGKPIVKMKKGVPVYKYNKLNAFNPVFQFGVHEVVYPEAADFNFSNIIINPRGWSKDKLDQTIQCLIVNYLLAAFPGKVVIHAYDPNGSAVSVLNFYNDKTKDVIIIENDVMSCIDKLTEMAAANLKTLSGGSVLDWNIECDKTGKTPMEYHVLFVISQPKSVEDDEAIIKFLEYSAQTGVFIVLVSENVDGRGMKNVKMMTRAFNGAAHPFSMINAQWCKQFANKFGDVIDQAKPAALTYQSFVDNVIPVDKIWTGNADKFIDFFPGYLNGDPAQALRYTIGNEGNVHVIGVGGTGAGKSVFLNHLTACICRYYPPWAVELWMCDFKGVEFQAYMKNYDPEHLENQRDYMLPHIAACLCTSDGDYATSLFKAFRNKADFRYEEMKAIGVKNMPGWNNFVRGNIGKEKPKGLIELHEKEVKQGKYNTKWTDDDIWPRVLFICDEFQVIFEKAEPSNLDSIKADITQIAKVARACGMHIFFTSQSMKKTLSADILQQFTLRFALRCDKEVSMEILGTTKASDIREKNGYLIVRSVEMDLEGQKRFKTPFLNDSPISLEKRGTTYKKDDKGELLKDKDGNPIVEKCEKEQSELFQNVKMIYDKAVACGYKFRDPITYSERTVHKPDEMVAAFNKAVAENKIPEGSAAFFLGMRMAYSPNKAPDNIIVGPKNNTHILAVFNDYLDIYKFFRTCVDSIKLNKNHGTIIINAAIEELGYLCEAETFVEERHKPLLESKNKLADIYKFIDTVYQNKKKSNVKDKPVWLIGLGWDKLTGLGVEPDSSMRLKFNNLLQQCAEYGIHVIAICTSLGAINSGTVSCFNYVVAGKCSADDSMSLLKSKLASKPYDIATGWFFIFRDGKTTRNKLWDFRPTREIVSSEVEF